MKKSVFLPVLLISGLLSFSLINATGSAKCSKFQSYSLAAKNKFYSQESKQAAFLEAVRIKRSLKTLFFGNKADYGAAQFWLDHGVGVSQEFKNDKLREAICYRIGAGIRFWLENGANLMSLTKGTCQKGLSSGAVWVELKSNGVLKINLDSGLRGHLAFIGLPGEDRDDCVKKAFRDCDFNNVVIKNHRL